MVIATASIAVSPWLYSNPGYDAQKDLAPIARLTNIPNVLIVHPSVPAKTLREFVNLARKQPGKQPVARRERAYFLLPTL